MATKIPKLTNPAIAPKPQQAATSRLIPPNDLYGKTKAGLGNPLPKMPRAGKMVPFARKPNRPTPLK